MSSPHSVPVSRGGYAYHGQPLRGLMKTVSSPEFQGRFGRMFRSLHAAKYGATDEESRANLMVLGAAMTASFDNAKDGQDPEESGIPALYTYLGQFIDHDITFDPVTTLVAHSDPDALTDFRTPSLDLDNVYGRGPKDQPYMYDGPVKFLLGEPLANGAPDLARNGANPARALIGDPRNDENSIVSQLQCLFLRFHNRVVDDNKNADFAALQQIVRFHYQWIVLHDFLPRIVRASVLDALKSADGKFDRGKLKFFHWKNEPFMPVEFSVAAYRLGHSMIRPGYRLNDDDSTVLPIFPDPPTDPTKGLTGFQAMAKNRGIDWARFVDTEILSYGPNPLPDNAPPVFPPASKRLQFAYRIDTSVVNPLANLPASVASDPPPSLPQRNLIRGFELGLPSGQAVARAMGIMPMKDDEITIGKFVDDPQGGDDPDIRGTIASIGNLAAFKGKCPLWTYILAEARHNQIDVDIPVTEKLKISTPQLGPVGGRIVAEVLLGMLFGDNDSMLQVDPNWTPTIVGPSFRLKDFVNYALGK
jgi:hypothetical protein